MALLGYDDDLLYEQRLLREAMPHRVLRGTQALEHGIKGMKWGVRKDRSSKADKAKKLANDPRTLAMMQKEVWGQKQQSAKEIHDTINTAASAGKVIKISYKKDEEDKPHTYTVEPYSFRGTKFFAFDRGDTRAHAKSFDFNSIVAAKATNKTYKPRWPVEIGKKKESGLRESGVKGMKWGEEVQINIPNVHIQKGGGGHNSWSHFNNDTLRFKNGTGPESLDKHLSKLDGIKESGLIESARNKAERVRLATETHVPQTKAKYNLTKTNEAELASVIRGSTSTAKSPFDVYVGKHAIEVKTIKGGKNDRIIMHPSSLRTKTIHASKRGLTTHTVVFDARPGKEAVYYREGLGSFRLNQMRKLPSVESIREALGRGDAGEFSTYTGPSALGNQEVTSNQSYAHSAMPPRSTGNSMEGGPGSGPDRKAQKIARDRAEAIRNARLGKESGILGMKWGSKSKSEKPKEKTLKDFDVPRISMHDVAMSLQDEFDKRGKKESFKEHGSDAVLNPTLRGEDLMPMAEANGQHRNRGSYQQQTVVSGEVHNNPGMFESTRLLDSNEYIRFREGGSGSGNFGHEGRPGEVGGSGMGGGGEKKKRSPNRPIGVKYGFAPGMMKKGFKNDIAKEMFGKHYKELESHQKSALKRELRNRGVVRPQGSSEASADEKKLMDAKTEGNKRDIGGGHVNDAYKITLEGGLRAVFKPQDDHPHRMRQNISTGHDAEREAGAWQVAKLVGLEGIAAPCVVRTIDDQRGSLQKMWDGTEAARVDKPYDGVEDMCKAAAFDYVIGNEDRHMGNWLVSGGGRLQLIDHGLCFPDKGSYGEAGDRDHKILAECANRERNDNLQGAPKISELAKVYTDKKNEILSALQKVGVPTEAINGVRQRIERMARKDKWADLNKKGAYAW